ncbi:coiled-coil domain-containing protein 105 isoform X3 [Oryzias latipes]|uniref:coiled-coil domain-containing protein 105 isoform X3 n=1 Tax=Oryzias latipes TaxID=8090 RepID=UPI0009D9E157|nr:coiled-coil domain-containing protein 105 isoform X3 [Oryzias latipes]
MQLQSVPVGSGSFGPPSWRERTVQSIRRAEHLVRQTGAGLSAACRRPLSAGFPQRLMQEASTDKIRAVKCAESRDSICSKKQTRARTAAVTKGSPAMFPPPGLRERCTAASSAMASRYMREVREVEAQLQRQAGRVTEEVTKLQGERGHLERALRGLRTDLAVNRRSREARSKRPAPVNTQEKDGADSLLLWERKELTELKLDLEEVLGNTRTQLQALGESSRRLLACASERAQVLELLPRSGSAGLHGATDHMQTLPNSSFTPKCKQVLESSSLAVQQSQLLRQRIRQTLSSATSRQNAAHLSVNDSLLQKVAEADGVQSLALTRAATRQAVSRKQREIKSIIYSRGRVQGPEYNSDTLTREKLNRPLVQVYQRHAAMRLPEAAHIAQGSAALTRCLTSCEGELAALQGACLQLLGDLHSQRAAAQVDQTILHMRRQQADRRDMSSFSSRGRAESKALTIGGATRE